MRIKRDQPIRLAPFKDQAGGTSRPEASAPIGTLLDRLSLAGASGALPPEAELTLRRLGAPGGALALAPADWRALAQAWGRADDRSVLADRLKAAGVSVRADAEGHYVSFTAAELRVTVEPATGRLRRAQGQTVLGYEGDRLAVAFKRDGNQVVATTAAGTQTWDARTGQGYADGLPLTPRMADPMPGEAPRRPWASAPPNRLQEPAWTDQTDAADYSRAYDAAMLAAGGRVVAPADMGADPADMYNCHAFATTGALGGLFDPFMREGYPHWINNPMAQLMTGPYRQLASTQRVRPGDVIVYRNAEGAVTHTGIVRTVDRDGNPSRVESKFGTLGRYEHGPFDIPPQYGAPAEFFRPGGSP